MEASSINRYQKWSYLYNFAIALFVISLLFLVAACSKAKSGVANDLLSLTIQDVMQLGDSFANGVLLYNVPGKYDGALANTIIRELFTNGLGYEKYTVYSNGGGKIQDNTDDPLEMDAKGSGKTREQALTEDPSLIIFITGGNDFATFQADTFRTDLRDHISAYLGVNGYASTNVQHVIVTNKLNATLPTLLATRDIIL